MVLEKLAFNREIFQDAFELRFRITGSLLKSS